jgi:hypothetical protein
MVDDLEPSTTPVFATVRPQTEELVAFGIFRATGGVNRPYFEWKRLCWILRAKVNRTALTGDQGAKYEDPNRADHLIRVDNCQAFTWINTSHKQRTLEMKMACEIGLTVKHHRIIPGFS